MERERERESVCVCVCMCVRVCGHTWLPPPLCIARITARKRDGRKKRSQGERGGKRSLPQFHDSLFAPFFFLPSAAFHCITVTAPPSAFSTAVVSVSEHWKEGSPSLAYPFSSEPPHCALRSSCFFFSLSLSLSLFLPRTLQTLSPARQRH